MKIPKTRIKKRINRIILRERTKTSKFYIDKYVEEIRSTLDVRDCEHLAEIQKLTDGYEGRLRKKDDEIRMLTKRDEQRERDYKAFLIQKSRLERQANKFRNITKSLVEDVNDKFIEFQGVVNEVDTVIHLENKQRGKRG